MTTQEDLQGHWARDWIKAPGFEDHTTRVHWMQAGDLYADLRIPLDRPDLTGHACLADLTPGELAMLQQAEGFAGSITVADSTCTWQRDINWHGLPQAVDAGLMWFDDAGDLIEDGVEADYRELWKSVPVAPLRGHRISVADFSGVLVENDDVFLFGLGPKPVSKASGPAQFTSVYCIGHWDGSLGIADLSTNPFCEGKPVLERDQGFIWYATGFDGAVTAYPLTSP